MPSLIGISNNLDPNIVHTTLSSNWTVVVVEPAMYIRNIIVSNEKLEPLLYFTSGAYCFGLAENGGDGCYEGTRNLTLFGTIITYIIVTFGIYLSSIIIAYGIGHINISRNKYI